MKTALPDGTSERISAIINAVACLLEFSVILRDCKQLVPYSLTGSKSGSGAVRHDIPQELLSKQAPTAEVKVSLKKRRHKIHVGSILSLKPQTIL